MYVYDHILFLEKEPLMFGLKELWTGNIPYFHLIDDAEVEECIQDYVLPVFPEQLRPLTIDSSSITTMCRACWQRPDIRPKIHEIVENVRELYSPRLLTPLVCGSISTYATRRMFLR